MRRSAQTALLCLATDLCRLAAPILCFTAEEVWQELEALHGRPAWGEVSVHVELFPEPLEIQADAALLERWDRLMKLRQEINKALEIERAAKRIRSSLETRVIVDSSDAETLDFLRSFGDELHFLLITSQVELGQVGEAAFRSEDTPGLAIEVRPADGEKCERCWNFTTDVGSDGEWPGICTRCSASVREILSEAGQT